MLYTLDNGPNDLVLNRDLNTGKHRRGQAVYDCEEQPGLFAVVCQIQLNSVGEAREVLLEDRLDLLVVTKLVNQFPQRSVFIDGPEDALQIPPQIDDVSIPSCIERGEDLLYTRTEDLPEEFFFGSEVVVDIGWRRPAAPREFSHRSAFEPSL